MTIFKKLPRGTCSELGCDLCHEDVKAVWSGQCASIPADFKRFWKFTVLNPVQVDAFESYVDESTPSMVACSGTGTGKTLIAEMAIIRQMELKAYPHVVMLVPLKSLATEKMRDWTGKFGDLVVSELTSDTKEKSGRDLNEHLKTVNITITSYEMFNSWTRKPDIYSFLTDVDLLIVDEVHSIGSVSRGGELDGSLTRFMLLRKKNPAQHVNLSATFDNVIDLKTYFEQFVPRMNIINKPFSPIVRRIMDLTVFNDFKGEAEKTLYSLIKTAHDKNPAGGVLGLMYSRNGVETVANELNAKFGANCARAHNARFTRNDRMSIEDEFRSGNVKILVASPTIAMGVNLPGQSIVMICDFWDSMEKKKSVVPKGDMAQIMGRAGRPPFFKEAFVYPAVSAKLENKYYEELEKKMLVIGQVTRVLDSVINSEVSKSSDCNVEKIFEWLKKTYSFISTDIELEKLAEFFTDELSWLVDKEFVILDEKGNLRPTKKGIACSDMMQRPRFIQDVIAILSSASFINNSPNTWTDEDLVLLLSDIYESKYSNVQVKDLDKDCEKLFSFEWMFDKRGYVDWKKTAPDYPFIREIGEDLSRMYSTIVRCGIPKTSPKLEALDLMNTAFNKGGIPLALVRLSKALSSMGIKGVGNKRLFLLYTNGLTAQNVSSGNIPDRLFLAKNVRSGHYLRGLSVDGTTFDGIDWIYPTKIWLEHRQMLAASIGVVNNGENMHGI
jgi:helicase